VKTYLAGPMRNHACFNFPAFDAAAADLRRQGITVISPAEIDRRDGFEPAALPDNWDWRILPEGFDLRLAVKRDIETLVTCDAIHLLPGWENSKGARAERAVAEWLGLGIFEYGVDETSPKTSTIDAKPCSSEA
jgi:hypothetical protein